MKKIFLIGIIFIIIGGVFLLVLSNNNSALKQSVANQVSRSRPSATPIPAALAGWKIYRNPEFSFSVAYPPDWNYMKLTHYNKNNLLAVVFNEISDPEKTVGVRILELKDAQSPEDWLSKYSSTDANADREKYTLTGVKNIRPDPSNGKKAAFDQELPDGTILRFTLIIRNNRVFLISSGLGVADDIYEKMLRSITS